MSKLTVTIPDDLHQKIREELERQGITTSQFIEQAVTTFFEKPKGVRNMATRTLAFQVSEELLQRIKTFLARYEQIYHRKLSQKEFLVHLIERELDEAEKDYERITTEQAAEENADVDSGEPDGTEMEVDELHLQELGERKIALFCCIPDSDKSLNYLVGMIYTQLIQTLYRQADRVHTGRLPVPVHCLMDEYANISLPKDTFLSALATMRSRAIFCSIIVQNMAQLKAMYKDDWESLVGLCDEFLYLGGTEKETHKYVSELLGKETISTTSYNQSKGRSGSYSINHQQSGRDLMTPDEVRLLDNSKCILFIRGERPVIDLKYNLLKHPNIRYTEDGGAAPYDYTAADNARDDLPGAPDNYELLDMDDFLPAEAAEMKPTIQRIRRPK